MTESSQVLARAPEGAGDTAKEGWRCLNAKSLGRISLLLSTARLALVAGNTQVSPPPDLHSTGLVGVLGERGVISVEKSSASRNKARSLTTNTYRIVSSPVDTHVPIAIL